MIEVAVKGLLIGEMFANGAAWQAPKPAVTGQNSYLPLATQELVTVLPSQMAFDTQLITNTPRPSIVETPSPVISSTPEISPVPTMESQKSVNPKIISEVNTGVGSEPTVAVSPYNPNLMVVTHQRVGFSDGCDLSGVRISTDGGFKWNEVQREPWSGGCPDFHGQVAWGPGPIAGSSRLWWVDAMIVGKHKISPGVTYSDDLGKTWSKMHIETRTPPWIGGFPDITVDNNQDSPNFGTAYVAYNWLESDKGPGLAVIASGDNGKTWAITQVPALKLEDYPYDWRIGYRIKTSPDGSAYVTSYQSNMKYWSKDNIFSQGGSGNIGNLGFTVARLHFDKIAKRVPDLDTPSDKINVVTYSLTAEPATWMTSVSKNFNILYDSQWQTGLDVDNLGRAWIAVSDNGRIDIGHTDIISSGNQRQETSPWMSFCIDGQSCFKPSLAIGGDMIFVGFHTLDKGMVRTYYMISKDRGETFLTPQLVTSYAWSWSSIGNLTNNVGLRENATSGVDANGNLVFVYAYSVARNGQPNVDVVVIDPGFQRNTSNDDLGMRE